MADVVINKFTGIVPIAHDDVVSNNVATSCENCDFTGGGIRALAPIDYNGFVNLSNSKNLGRRISSAELLFNQRPAPIVASSHVAFFSSVSGWFSAVTQLSTGPTVGITDNIITFYGEVAEGSGTTEDVHNVAEKYVLLPAVQLNALTNGPTATLKACPDSATTGGVSGFPKFECNIRYKGNIIGQLRTIAGNCSGGAVNVRWITTAVNGAVTGYSTQWSRGLIKMNFSCKIDFIRDKQQKMYFLMTYLINEDEDIESPPSEIHECDILSPNKFLKLELNSEVAGKTVRIYASSTGKDDFALIRTIKPADWSNSNIQDAYISSSKYYFEYIGLLSPTQEIGKFGNFPVHRLVSGANEFTPTNTQIETGRSIFSSRSFIHPGGFGVSYVGSTLYISDIFRLYCWPEENTVGFESNILSLALSGDTILVFTENFVYAMSGGDPEKMSRYQISKDSVLNYSDKSIAMIHDNVYWVSKSGEMFIFDGGRVINLTNEIVKDFIFDATNGVYSTWTPETKATLSSALNLLYHPENEALYLVSLSNNIINGKVLIFKISNEGAVSSLSFMKSSAGFSWIGNPIVSTDKSMFDILKIHSPSDASGTLNVSLNAGTESPISVAGTVTDVVLTGDARSSVKISMTGDKKISEIGIYERRIFDISESMTISRNELPSFKSFYLKFPDVGSIGAIIVKTIDDSDVKLTIDGGGGFTKPISISSGRTYSERSPLIQKRNLWNIKCVTNSDKIENITFISYSIQNYLDRVAEKRGDSFIPPWMRKKYVSSHEVVLGCAKIYATSYPCVLKIYDTNSTLLCSCTISNSNAVRLPKFKMLKEFYIDVTEPMGGICTDLFISGSMDNLRYGGNNG